MCVCVPTSSSRFSAASLVGVSGDRVSSKALTRASILGFFVFVVVALFKLLPGRKNEGVAKRTHPSMIDVPGDFEDRLAVEHAVRSCALAAADPQWLRGAAEAGGVDQLVLQRVEKDVSHASPEDVKAVTHAANLGRRLEVRHCWHTIQVCV